MDIALYVVYGGGYEDKQLDHFLTHFSLFSPTQYMSVSHGYNTMGGIEYDDRGKYREDKKVRKSHIDPANQQAMVMPIN